MAKHTFIIRGDIQRQRAKQAIDQAPIDYVVKVEEQTRSNPQNNHMWALLSEISIAKPEGRTHTPELWKALAMKACGHEVQFLQGLDGQPFPIGFRSSKLTVSQMSDLIEWIYAYGSENGVIFKTPALAA